MFMDSAQKIDSMASHAKELNYLPQSKRSSIGEVSFTITAENPVTKLDIPKGTIFTGLNSNGAYNFVTGENSSYIPEGNDYYIENLKIYEGSYVNESFVVDHTNELQRFILSNPDVDITSLTVNVIENNGESNTTFIRAETLYNLNADSTIYFLQSAQNNQYEVLFGDGILGKVPQNGSVVLVSYRITKGSEGNGISTFKLQTDLRDVEQNSILGNLTKPEITVVANSAYGAMAESIESIRFKAPRYFAAQQRAVSNDDYASLVLAKFGNLVSDVSVFGGEILNPKQYGTVVVTIKPSGTTAVPDYLKNEISSYLLNLVTIPTKITIAEPDYLYIQLGTTVQYDNTLTNLSSNDIKALTLNTIKNYSENSLEKFHNDFRYSRLVSAIDDSDVSIVSNDTSVRLIKKLSPVPGVSTNLYAEFNNPAFISGPYYGASGVIYTDEPAIQSSAFTYNDFNDCFLRDDSAGNIFVFQLIKGAISVVNSKVGTIDYTTGRVVLSNFAISNYGKYLNIYFTPQSKDLYANKNKILVIDPADVSIAVTGKQD